MDEDVLVRFIAIGASIFMTITVFAIVMNYYSGAKDLGNNTEYEVEKYYSSNIESIIYDSDIDGADVKNLINYYYKSNSVVISVKDAKVTNKDELFSCDNANMFYNDSVSGHLINETQFKTLYFNLDVNQKFTLQDPEENNGIVIYTLIGNNN